jgi:hypothetical protein
MTPVHRRKKIWETERINILLDSPYTNEIYQAFEKIKLE